MQDLAQRYGKSNEYKKRINQLTPELNPSAQRCLTRIFTGDIASLNSKFR
jgi:hypothetical protein